MLLSEKRNSRKWGFCKGQDKEAHRKGESGQTEWNIALL